MKATEERLEQEDMLRGIVDRNRIIVRTSIVGIAANLFLAAFKAAIGIVSNSIAITMDAVNNLSDAGSSIITIIGTRIASKQPDRRHPFGYGRVEYLSALVIAVIVLYAGITSFVESVKKIIHPEESSYSAAALIIIAMAVVVKLVLGRYVVKKGESVDSDSLINSGKDAGMDALISLSTLIAAGIFLIFHVSLEAWFAAVISLLIVKSGVEMISETLSEILGERADASLIREIKKTVTSFPDIYGAYDLVLHNYGPDNFNGSVHIEVDDTKTAEELDELIRAVTEKVYFDHRVILTAIGVYSRNTQDPEAISKRELVGRLVTGTEGVLQMHGFFWNEKKKTVRFDAVVSFDVDRKKTYEEIMRKVTEAFPGYQVSCALDTDFSDL